MAAVMDATLEQQYLDQCRRGRLTAFRPLVEAYFARAVRLAGALVGATDAEDVAQEAFVAAFKAIATHKSGMPFYPWLRGILVNRAKVHTRTRVRARNRVDLAAQRPGHWTRPAENAGRLEADLLARVLNDLDASDRMLLVLKHVEGYTYDELAAQLAIPRGTLMSRLYRARQRCRERIERLDPKWLVDADDDEGSVDS